MMLMRWMNFSHAIIKEPCQETNFLQGRRSIRRKVKSFLLLFARDGNSCKDKETLLKCFTSCVPFAKFMSSFFMGFLLLLFKLVDWLVVRVGLCA